MVKREREREGFCLFHHPTTFLFQAARPHLGLGLGNGSDLVTIRRKDCGCERNDGLDVKLDRGLTCKL